MSENEYPTYRYPTDEFPADEQSTRRFATDAPGGFGGPGTGGAPIGPGHGVASSGRHPINVGHLVMGIALSAFVVVWALLTSHAIEPDQVRWFLPVPWVLGGLGGAAAIFWTGARRRRRAELDRSPTD